MEKLVKCPLNYIGSKYKLLPQLKLYMPDNISTFYDVFGGGANVALNIKSEHTYYNDINHFLKDMFQGMQGKEVEEILSKIDNIIAQYGLSKTNREGFNTLRNDYNNGLNSWEYLFVLVCFSFNNQIRFNSKHEYNSSFGLNRSDFTSKMRANLIDFINAINSKDIVFDSRDFREIDFSDADENDLVYFDPPYLLSCGVYQDGKRGFSGWSEKEETDLYALCDKLDKQGARFALSNLLQSKGQTNNILKEWGEKYNVHYIEKDYKHCNHQRKDYEEDLEVLITNY